MHHKLLICDISPGMLESIFGTSEFNLLTLSFSVRKNLFMTLSLLEYVMKRDHFTLRIHVCVVEISEESSKKTYYGE